MKLLTIEAAAPLLSVSERRLYAMARQGLLPPGVTVRLGRQVRVDEDALRRWAQAGGQSLETTGVEQPTVADAESERDDGTP